MTFKALFAIPILVILLVTLSLAGMIVSQEWAGHQRGAIAIAAVERADILNRLENQLSTERIATWDAFEADYPLPAPVAHELAASRAETDRVIGLLIANQRTDAVHANDREPWVPRIQASLAGGRERVDALLNTEPTNRTYEALRGIMPRMLTPVALLEPRLALTATAVITAEPDLAGIVAVARIGLALRDTLGGIAAATLPRLDAGEQLTKDDIRQVMSLLIQVDTTTKLMEFTFHLASPTDEMRRLLASAKRVREGIVQRQLDLMIDTGARGIEAERPNIWSSRPVAIWAEHINALRNAILVETLHRVQVSQAARDRRLDLACTAAGAVALIILAVLVVLQRRVVRPLAQLGLAIARIADGDRRTRLAIHSTTREIAAMVTAVETLRQAALVADAAALRQREAAESRLLVLREVLAILRAVSEPSQSLEREVASLSLGIDAIVALMSSLHAESPPTLSAAATAVRAALRELRESTRALDQSGDAACQDEMPETEIVARIGTVRAHIDRRDALVRTFLQPCLMALRDISPLAGSPPAGNLHDLIDDQFELIESTVATLASMRASAAHAADIVRKLPPDIMPMAA